VPFHEIGKKNAHQIRDPVFAVVVALALERMRDNSLRPARRLGRHLDRDQGCAAAACYYGKTSLANPR
jgi:hypothetical protein